jgi:hypothetical protein
VRCYAVVRVDHLMHLEREAAIGFRAVARWYTYDLDQGATGTGSPCGWIRTTLGNKPTSPACAHIGAQYAALPSPQTTPQKAKKARIQQPFRSNTKLWSTHPQLSSTAAIPSATVRRRAERSAHTAAVASAGRA